MPELENTRSNRWLTALTVDEKEAGVSISALLKTMAEQNIEARPVWKPLHLQPLFEGATYYSHSKAESVSDDLFQTGICLPSGSSMTVEDQERVIQCMESVWKEAVSQKNVSEIVLSR